MKRRKLHVAACDASKRSCQGAAAPERRNTPHKQYRARAQTADEGPPEPQHTEAVLRPYYMSVMLLGVQRVVAALVLGANVTDSDAVFDGMTSAILRA